MEDMFSGSDKMKLIRKEYTKTNQFSKKKLNLAIETLYAKNIYVECDQETLGNFEEMYSFFCKALATET